MIIEASVVKILDNRKILGEILEKFTLDSISLPYI